MPIATAALLLFATVECHKDPQLEPQTQPYQYDPKNDPEVKAKISQIKPVKIPDQIKDHYARLKYEDLYLTSKRTEIYQDAERRHYPVNQKNIDANSKAIADYGLQMQEIENGKIPTPIYVQGAPR